MVRGWFPFVGFGYGAIAGLIYWSLTGRNAGLMWVTHRAAQIGIVLIVSLVVLFPAALFIWFN
jgi:hypothetical protein